MNVICDDCQKEYEIEMRIEQIDGIEKNYFTCPHCDKEYVAFCTNQSVRVKQAEMKMLYRKLNGARTKSQFRSIQDKLDKLEKKIKTEMESLKKSLNKEV